MKAHTIGKRERLKKIPYLQIGYICILSLTLLLACGKKQETTSPILEKITESVYASGYVKSNHQYQVFAKTSGILQKANVQKGDMVHKGQVLFTINQTLSILNHDNAKLVAANADYQTNTDKLNELKLGIDLSKKKMDMEQLTLTRQQRLWSNEIGTKFELEQRELAFANAKSAYKSAELRYTELQKQLNFASNQSKKSLEISKSMLDDYQIRSDVEGKIYSIFKEEGEMVTPQVPLALIGDASNYILILQVDENDIVNIHPGQKLFVTMDSYKGQLFQANITKINPLMNERSRSFEVEASFTQQPPVLYPNLTVEANIVLQSKENVLTIPRKYLVDEEYVWISATEKRKVKVGLKDYQKAEILEGLSTKDKIYLPQ